MPCMLQDCSFDTLSAAAIHILFPVMRSDHGYIQLSGSSSVTSGALGILAAQTCINELELGDCLPTPGMLLELASFESLKSLALVGGVNPGGLSLEPLCGSIPCAGPQLRLTKLKLEYLRDVTGLDVCLAHHPLQELQLVGVLFPVSFAPSTRLASSTLRVMRTLLNLTLPVISVANFPALQSLEIGSLDLKQIPGISAEESVQRCICLASSIAGLPSVRITYGYADDDEEVTLRGDGWPPAQFMELLQGLAPLRAAFQSVKNICISEANVGSGAVRAIASLSPNLEMLRLCTQVDVPRHSYSDEYGLSDAVSRLPHLKYLEVVCESPPRDTIRVLTKTRWDFVLQLVATNDGCRRRLEEIRLQWDAVRLDNPKGARMEVASLGD
ncbi:hypothetical protein DUNSADRAFT_13876 [Dunaliella salina]|uniref:Encoded protein n=1 Tax=Dunaliella salina TaxID=3046 RepID=A0ABQ7H356_DUNSA|nr:hypothetical protein DUNSADRAFT_13876 [Dunaliella salina]|eukprot:KAF5841231.1 hypothetical protein DUNSADRAFT_13876 [Dunaliella salina]